MASGLFSSIQSLSTKLIEAIRGTTSPNTNQNKSVREDLEKLSWMLARIQAVQQDAEEREIHDRSVRLWLEELRGVGYQAEDVLDEFYYEVLRSIVESGDDAIKAYHREHGNKRKFAEIHTSSSLASYSFTITKVSIPDGMAEKIKDITERLQEISNARRDLHLREEDGTRLVIGPQTQPPTSSHVDERAIFGREKEKENIISILNPLNDPEFMVLPIIGMGGLGKTTLAQLVYNDSNFLQLFDKSAWVSVTEDFDLVRLTRAIVESINRTTCEFSELSTLQDILNEKIRDVSLFLVLDDVWNENTELWEHFQVALNGGKTVKILTTTRNTSVAEIMQTTTPIQLDCLSDEKCWSLFKHFAFHNGEASENANLLEIGRCIVKKCKGSPLVTKVLGGILRYEIDEDKWMEVFESDISEIDESGKIFTPLQLSYQKLPLHLKPCFVYLAIFPKGTLIDKDDVVRLWMAQGYINSNSRTKKTLEEIGSEYLNELQGRSLIDFGFFNTCYIHDLIHDVARSISQRTTQPVLENENLWNSSYKINHLYLTEKHELSDFLASCNNKVIRTYVREYPRNYMGYYGECPRNYKNDSAIFPKITYVRAIKLRNCMLPDTLSTLKHLRFLSIKDYKIESLPESLCLLYHLQTLDMICHNILELPEKIKTLVNLRFLRLCSSKIKQLPESISLLHNLDTLSIEFCSKLEKLPRSIEQLNLHVLNLSEYTIGNLSSGIRKLTNLITLSGLFKVMGSDMTRGLGEFRDMNRLSGLMSITGLKNIGNIEYSRKVNLVSKSNLSKLILNFEEDSVARQRFLKYGYQDPFFCIAISSSTNSKNENDEQIQEGVLESLQPHGNLTELVIINYRGRRVPPWLLDPSLMPKLTTLTLHFHMDFIYLPPLLGQLLHLKSLQICWSGDTVRKVGDEHLTEFLLAKYSSNQTCGVSFSSCKEPLLNNMLHLGEWQAGDECCLEKLIINNCPKLWKVTIPQKLEVLEGNACGCQEIKFSSPSELKKLSISNCRELITIYYRSGDLPFLKRISLSGCPNLSMLSAIPQKVEVFEVNACGCQEIKFFSPLELKKLSISNCTELTTIYYKSGDLPFLKSISISGCPNLSMLSAIPQKVEVLEINACGCQEIKFSSPSELRKLSITNCRELITIYYKSGDLPFLKNISLSGCPNLSMLLAMPQKVEVLQVNACGFQEIKFTSPSELKRLSISNCRELITIYYKSGDLPFLKSISLSVCPSLSMLSAIPQKVEVLEVNGCGCQEITFSSPSVLKKLLVSNCRELVAIYYKSGDLPFLVSISLYGCPNLLMLSAIPQELKQLDIENCGFQEINFSSLSKLQKISIVRCRELVSISYKIGDIPFLGSVSLSGCPKLLIFSVILEEMNQIDKRNSGFQSEIQNVLISDYREFIPPVLRRVSLSNCPKLRIFSAIRAVLDTMEIRRVSLSNCPKLRIFSAIPAVLDTMEIIDCGIHEIILPSRCKLLEINNCRELIAVHWRDGNSSSLPLVKFVDCPQLKLLKIPKEVEILKIKSCGTHEIFFSSRSMVRSVEINGCRKLFSIHWMDRDVSFLKDLFFEGCPELISLQFLQGDLPLLEKFAIKSCPQFHEVLTIPYQLKEIKIVDCCFPEIHLLPQSKLQRLIIRECANLTAIKGLQVQFPMGDVSHPMMEMVEIRNCPRMDFGTQGKATIID